jgi:alpha-glucosidase (family GH31 glycosyl hydrolase)
MSNLSLYSNNESNLSIFLNPTYIAKELEDLSFINYLFIHKSNLLIKNKLLLKYLNIVGISESKYYYHYLKEKRPLIISTKSTVCSGTYSIKYLNNVSYSYEGMLEVIKQNKKENLFGNPYILSEFNKKSYEINKDNEELKIRWSQLLSILPLVSPGDLEIPLYYKNFRYIFGIYLYTYYIVIASEGGSFIRPLYFDLKTLNYTQQLLFNENQIMFGSNIMLIPITEKNKLNISCYFPRERFYDFYSGELINRDGEGFYNIIYKDYYKMPIFLRGGKITPFQLMDISNEELSQKEFSTKLLINQSIQIIISLDSNFQASGRIYLDNFYNTDARNKKIFYKMLISVSQRTTDASIFFKVYSFKYKIPQNLFNNSINKIIIYGFSKIGVKRLTIMNKNGRIVLDKNSYSFSQTNDILIIKDISIPLDMDTKILIL